MPGTRSGAVSTSSILILNLLMLAVVCESDLGRRRITLFRVARPVLGVTAIAPFFLSGAATHGWGLALEVVGIALGLGLGLLAGALLPVHYDPADGRAYSRGGLAYALFWVVITGGRVFFSYGAQHLFAHPFGAFLATRHVSPGALGDAFIFLFLAMYLTRSGSLLIRARTSRPDTPADLTPARTHT
jgi:hypothetical protein